MRFTFDSFLVRMIGTSFHDTRIRTSSPRREFVDKISRSVEGRFWKFLHLYANGALRPAAAGSQEFRFVFYTSPVFFRTIYRSAFGRAYTRSRTPFFFGSPDSPMLSSLVLLVFFASTTKCTPGKGYVEEYVDSGQCGPINEIKRYTETTAVVRYCAPANQGSILWCDSSSPRSHRHLQLLAIHGIPRTKLPPYILSHCL